MKPLIFTGFFDISYLASECGFPYSVWLSREVFSWCYGTPCFDDVQSREGGIFVSIGSEARHNDFSQPKSIRVKALGDTVWINVVKQVANDGTTHLLVFFASEDKGRMQWRWPPANAHGEI